MDGHGDKEMEAEKQIQVRFTTKLPPALRVVSSAFAVPAKLTRYGLSDVVNTLLGLGMFWTWSLRERERWER